MLKEYSLYVMAGFYLLAGVMHFVNPGFFRRIVPPYFPKSWVNPLVVLSGIAEIILGVGLTFSLTRSHAAWGVIALLIAVFPANLYHYQSGGAGMKIPKWALVIRLPMQFALMLWAWWYT